MDKKTVIIIVLAILLTFVVSFSAALFFLSNKNQEKSQEDTTQNQQIEQTVNQNQEATNNTETQEDINAKIVNNMKNKHSQMFDNLVEQQKKDAENVEIDDPIAEIDNVGKKFNGFFSLLVFLVQHINVFFITLMSIFGFIMSWLYRNSPGKSKGWLVFAVGAPVVFFLAIYGPPLYSSIQGR